MQNTNGIDLQKIEEKYGKDSIPMRFLVSYELEKNAVLAERSYPRDRSETLLVESFEYNVVASASGQFPFGCKVLIPNHTYVVRLGKSEIDRLGLVFFGLVAQEKLLARKKLSDV